MKKILIVLLVMGSLCYGETKEEAMKDYLIVCLTIEKWSNELYPQGGDIKKEFVKLQCMAYLYCQKLILTTNEFMPIPKQRLYFDYYRDYICCQTDNYPDWVKVYFYLQLTFNDEL